MHHIPASVSQTALDHEGEHKADRRKAATDDEEWLEDICANV
jgi:hypothetical protein